MKFSFILYNLLTESEKAFIRNFGDVSTEVPLLVITKVFVITKLVCLRKAKIVFTQQNVSRENGSLYYKILLLHGKWPILRDILHERLLIRRKRLGYIH